MYYATLLLGKQKVYMYFYSIILRHVIGKLYKADFNTQWDA